MSDGPICGDEVGHWFALDDEQRSLENHIAALEELINESQVEGCDPAKAQPGVVCFDSFIADHWLGSGDNRGHEADVHPDRSRVQTLVNFNIPFEGSDCSANVSFKPSATKIRLPGGLYIEREPWPGNQVTCQVVDGRMVVRGRFRNSITPSVPIEIKFDAVFARDASAPEGWSKVGNVQGTRFPSLTYKRAVNGHWVILERYDQVTRNAIVAGRELWQKAGELKQLPPYCQLQ